MCNDVTYENILSIQINNAIRDDQRGQCTNVAGEQKRVLHARITKRNKTKNARYDKKKCSVEEAKLYSYKTFCSYIY